MRALIITIAAICVFSLNIFAQDNSDKKKKNTLKAGYGSTFHSNEMVGNLYYGEYTRFLGKRFALSGSGGFVNANNENQDAPRDYAFEAYKGDLNLYLLPVNNSKSSLKLGGGATYFSGDFSSRDTLVSTPTLEDVDGFGWNLVGEFEIYVANTLVIGSRAAFTKAENGENFYFFGLNAGLKF